MSEKAFAFVLSPSLFVFGVKCFTVTPFPPPPPSLPLQCQAGKNGNKYSRVEERERPTYFLSSSSAGEPSLGRERKLTKKPPSTSPFSQWGGRRAKTRGLAAW